MAMLAIEETFYDALEANEEDALRWMQETALNVPACYEAPSGESWLVFDHRFTLDEVAWWGCLLDNMRRVGRLWEPPKQGDSDDVDREAAQAETQAMVSDLVVLPEDIEYTHVVDVEVPIREYVEGSYVHEETGETVTYWYWRDTGETEIIQQVEALPNRWQVTLDAQGVSPLDVLAFEYVPADWSPRSEEL